MEDELEQQRVRDLGHRALLDLDAPTPPVFTHAESIVGSGGLGLSKSKVFDDLVENYRQLFCRRCFVYDCKNHFIAQPMPRVQQDPLPPFPCPVPGLALPTDPHVSTQRKTARVYKKKGSGNEFMSASTIKRSQSTDTNTSNGSKVAVTNKETSQKSFIDSFGRTLAAAVTKTDSSSHRATTGDTDSVDGNHSHASSAEGNHDETMSNSAPTTARHPTPPHMLYRHLLLSADSSTSSATTVAASGSGSNKKVTARGRKGTKANSGSNSSVSEIPWTDVEIAILEKLLKFGTRVNKYVCNIKITNKYIHS